MYVSGSIPIINIDIKKIMTKFDLFKWLFQFYYLHTYGKKLIPQNHIKQDKTIIFPVPRNKYVNFIHSHRTRRKKLWIKMKLMDQCLLLTATEKSHSNHHISSTILTNKTTIDTIWWWMCFLLLSWHPIEMDIDWTFTAACVNWDDVCISMYISVWHLMNLPSRGQSYLLPWSYREYEFTMKENLIPGIDTLAAKSVWMESHVPSNDTTC